MHISNQQKGATKHDGMQHNYPTPQVKPSYIQIKNKVDNEEDSLADTYNNQDPQTTSKNNQSKHKFISIAQGIRNMFGKPPEPKRAIMSPENDTELN